LASFVIDDLPRNLDFAPEVWIANATLSQQINFATEKPLDSGSKIEVAVRVGTGGLIREADDEIEVALRGIEVTARRRSEYFEPPHSEAPALFSQAPSVFVDERPHVNLQR